MSANNTYQQGIISRSEREALINQSGATIWFTGISGSGKSSIAIELERALYKRGLLSYRLDGDNLRLGINKDLGFSAEDRSENVRRVGEVSALIGDLGAIVLSSLISPYQIDRDCVRALHKKRGIPFVEVFVDCSLEEAERRDPKGLYAKARAKHIKNFTAVDHPYEAPANPDLHLNTEMLTLEQEIDTVVDYLVRKNTIPK
ncbi:MAG: hypothetical protein DHS20C12_17800 [Pseudohongiella sp.]|nr:MAG: hypothetical protein DHS20C12_17800 [Pseudohongiella sp.]